MDFATRKRLFNLCNPNEPLVPGDARYVDVDGIPGDVRGGRFMERIAQRIELSDAPITSFVTAQRGVGLTTELRRLDERLRAKDGANLFVVFLDVTDFVDLTEPLHAEDLLFGLWAKTEDVVASAIGKPMSQHARRFWKWLSQTEVELKAASSELAIAWNPSVKEGMRKRFTSDRTRVIDEIRNEFYVLQNEVEKAGYRGIVVVVDGLNGLRGVTANAHGVLESAERVFAGDVLRWRLPIHVVWTVPSGLMLRPLMPIDVLPHITVEFPNGHTYETGRAALERIVYARIPPTAFMELLGGVSWHARFTELVNASFGNIRDVLRLLQECILVDQLDDATFSRVIAHFVDSWRRVTTRNMLGMLGEVHRSKSLAHMDHVAAEDAVAWQFVVLNAPGGTYEVHPALRDMLPLRDAYIENA